MGLNGAGCGNVSRAFLAHSGPAGCPKRLCTGPECFQKLQSRPPAAKKRSEKASTLFLIVLLFV
jgi:hypothetical protein